MKAQTVRSQLAKHWFVALAPAMVAVDFAVARSGAITGLVEAGLLFDLIVFLPCLYFVCYRRRGTATAVRAIGLACLGVWVATKLIPGADRVLLVHIAPLRYVGLMVVVLLELAIIRLIYKTLAASGSEVEAARRAQQESGMPPWAARLMAWEMGFWRKVFVWTGRLFGRGQDDT